jgi:peptide/nickel transport system substrate-binding protein
LLLASLAPALTLGLATPAGAADKVTFTVAFQNEPDSLNPFLGIEAESFEMWALMYDYLIGYSMDDMSVDNSGLAESWDTSADGLTWTFHIRSGVTWSDGQDLTAADVAYTYNRILDGGPEAATWGSYLKGVDTVTAPDAATVVLTTKKPNAVLPLLPIPIIPEHIWKDVSEQDVKTFANDPVDGQPPVGSGPFRLVEGKGGGSLFRFEANADYWKGAPHIDELVFRVYKSEDPAIAALKTGEVDFAEGISAVQVNALQGQDGITAINGDSPGFDEIAFNTGSIDLDTGKPIGDPNPAMLDAKFRYALGFAIDRDQLIERVYQGAGQPGTTIIPPAYAQYRWDPPADVAFTFDLDKAGQLLDEAGYTMGSDGKRTLPDGSPLGTLRLAARTDSPTSLGTMNYFKEWLGDLGIDARVDTYESSKLTDVILEGTFDMFQWGWYVEPDPNSMLDYLTCGQLGNWSDSWYCDDTYDQLYEEQRVTIDKAKRVELVKQMQEQLYLDAPYLVTAYSAIGEAWRSDRFACLRPQPDPGGIMIMQYGVYNYLNMRPAAEADQCAGQQGVSQATKAAADNGVGSGVLIGGGVVLLALLGAGGFVMMRRRGTAGDRE